MCHRLGDASTHHDESHDQKLTQIIPLPIRNDGENQTNKEEQQNITIEGGTTKCARVAIAYFYTLNQPTSSSSPPTPPQSAFCSSRVLELGAGTGLVGLSLSRLSSLCYLTDQSPILPLLQQNIYKNMSWSSIGSRQIQVKEMLWGEVEQMRRVKEEMEREEWRLEEEEEEEEQEGESGKKNGVGEGGKSNPSSDVIANLSAPSSRPSIDFVIGCDLIYARETIAALVSTYEFMCSSSTRAFLIHIRRFAWEDEFFEGMKRQFTSEKVHSFEDIDIYEFRKIKPQ